MVHVETYRRRGKHIARASLQVNVKPFEIPYESLVRGISSGQIFLSYVIQTGKTTCINLSTFGKAKSMEKAIQIASLNMQPLKSLLVGCEFSSTGINPIQARKHSALVYVLGLPHIGFKNQTQGLIHGLNSTDTEATIITNIYPVSRSEEERKAEPITEHRDEYLVKDSSFLITYAFFLTDDDLDKLKTDLETLVALLGSVYDSEHSEVQVHIETQRKAVKSLQKLLWGEILYSTILTTREFIAIFQIPQIYGIETVDKPSIYVPPSTRFHQEGIKIGIVLGKFNEPLYPAFINPNTTSPHIVLWGATGLGKSNLIKHLAEGLHNNYGYGILIFDHHNEYRSIVPRLHGKIGGKILIINPHITPPILNPLQIPDGLSGRDREIAVLETKENFMHTIEKQLGFIIGDVQRPRCEIRMDERFKETNNPRISEVIDLLKQDKLTKTKKDEDNLPIKLSRLTTGFYGEIFDRPYTTLPLDKMNTATTIFELGSWPIELRTFFTMVYLTQWWNRRITQNPEELEYIVIILDEFHHYDEMPIIKKMLSEGRKYKIIITASHQGPYQITDRTLLGDLVRNTASKIVFQSTLRPDIELVLSSIGLRDRKWFDYLTRLELGEAIVSLYGIPQPFKISTEQYPETEKIPDEVVKENVKLLPEPEIEEEEALADELEDRFLRLVYENQYCQASEIINELGIMRGEGYKIKNKLVQEGLIIEETVRTGIGRPKKILSLTDAAYDLLNIEKQGEPAHHGGIEHIMMRDEIAEILVS